MLIKAILVGLVLGLCKSEWIYGFPQVGRPIVVSTLTGLFLGDPVQGVIMGSVLELMFIGSFPIGQQSARIILLQEPYVLLLQF